MYKKILVVAVLLIGFVVAISFAGQVPAKPFRGSGMITDSHAKIHLGEIYENDFIDIAVADDDYIKMLIDLTSDTVTTDELHAFFGVTAGGDALFTLYEGVHCTSSGTLVTSYNLNRDIADSPTVLIYHTPTVIVSSGTPIIQELIPGGTGGNAGGGGMSKDAEVVLEGASYLAIIQNISGGTKPAGSHILFYEALEP